MKYVVSDPAAAIEFFDPVRTVGPAPAGAASPTMVPIAAILATTASFLLRFRT